MQTYAEHTETRHTDKREEILKIFSMDIRGVLKHAAIDYAQLQEIRLRVNAPILCVYQNREYYVNRQGELCTDSAQGWIIGKKEIQETVEYIGNYSLYAYEEEVRQGFITIQGGHRIGIAGKAIVENGRVKSLKYISFLNFLNKYHYFLLIFFYFHFLRLAAHDYHFF